MSNSANLQLMILAALVVFSWLMLKLVRFNKTRRINTELWCTVIEGLTQGAIRLDDLKAPEAVIEKKLKRDGKDKDAFDPPALPSEPGCVVARDEENSGT